MPCDIFKTLIVGIWVIFLCAQAHAETSKVVNVYNWAYGLTPEIIQQFEEETGIKVNYDVYDSSEVMETKLLTGHSGYDVVIVTVWPYFARQLVTNLYQPLQLSLIPNRKGVDIDFFEQMANVDPGNQFAIPLLWGTSGFAINRTKILERLPNAPLQSLAMLFDPSIVANFVDCGVMLLDSPVDVFPAVLKYLNKDPNSEDLNDLKQASDVLSYVKPYIKKFGSVPSGGDLILGNYCIVEGYSGELLLAQKLGQENGVDIQYIIPEEGAALWVDAMAILKGAEHVSEAHAFINFLLRPDIIAKLTNALETANSVPASLSFINERIKNNPLIYPSNEIMEKLYVDKPHPPQYERFRLRAWTRVKVGR